MSDGDNRKMGVEFGELDEKLEAHDYPATADELVAEYGDYEIVLQDETVTFREVLEPLQGETYDGKDAVTQSVLNMVGDEAVGRKDYTDRGASEAGTSSEDQSESF